MKIFHVRVFCGFLFFIYFFSFRREIIGGMGGRRGKPFRFFFSFFSFKNTRKAIAFFAFVLYDAEYQHRRPPLKTNCFYEKTNCFLTPQKKQLVFIDIYDADLQHYTAVRKAIALFAFLAISLAGLIFGLSRKLREHVGDTCDSRLLVLVENLCIDLSRR